MLLRSGSADCSPIAVPQYHSSNRPFGAQLIAKIATCLTWVQIMAAAETLEASCDWNTTSLLNTFDVLSLAQPDLHLSSCLGVTWNSCWLQSLFRRSDRPEPPLPVPTLVICHTVRGHICEIESCCRAYVQLRASYGTGWKRYNMSLMMKQRLLLSIPTIRLQIFAQSLQHGWENGRTWEHQKNATSAYLRTHRLYVGHFETDSMLMFVLRAYTPSPSNIV